jgi:hypothetical protein
MPAGKPAGVRCVQLSADNRCLLFGRPERPAICARLRPGREMCGASTAEALAYLAALESATAPAGSAGDAGSTAAGARIGAGASNGAAGRTGSTGSAGSAA